MYYDLECSPQHYLYLMIFMGLLLEEQEKNVSILPFTENIHSKICEYWYKNTYKNAIWYKENYDNTGKDTLWIEWKQRIN